MFSNPSLMTRIAIGKGLGFLCGLAGFVILTYLSTDTSIMLHWGILLWYTTFGAIIAAFGTFTYHPMIKLSMPWWFRGPWVGAWLNFVLTLFAYDVLQQLMLQFFGADGLLRSPFWFVAEGALLGLLIDYFATRYGGEGMAAVAADAP